MKPAKRALVLDLHPFQGDDQGCCRHQVGGRVCGLPASNRHHRDGPPPPPPPEGWQDRKVRLDVDG